MKGATILTAAIKWKMPLCQKPSGFSMTVDFFEG